VEFLELNVRPATLPWLVQHEVRLSWRNTTLGRPAPLLILFGICAVALHAVAYMVLSHWPSGVGVVSGLPMLGALMAISASLMLAQAISRSVSALFDRGDLDLLLSSPLPTQHVFMARGLGIALSLCPFQLAVLGPFANVGPFTGHAHLLAIYPVLAVMALCMTALGLGLTLALVRLLGARRAKTVAQVFGSLIGALFFLVTQAQSLLSPAQHERWNALLESWTAPGGVFAPDSVWLFPARALLGEALPLLAFVLLGVGCFVAMVRLTHRRFVSGTQESLDGGARGPAIASGSLRFRRGIAVNMLLKEWRLILRDPQLISKTLLQVLYLVPLCFMTLRSQDPVRLLAGIELLALTLASALAWITVAAEDAPELLACAPASLTRLNWLKVLAAVMPVWVLTLPLPVYLAAHSPWVAAVIFLCVIGGTLNVAASQVWYPRRGHRSNLAKRGQGHWLVGLLDLVLSVCWAGLTYGIAVRSLYAGLLLLPILAGSGWVWLLGRDRRAEPGSY
jgi:ABC-2 type transport system permease protein